MTYLGIDIGTSGVKALLIDEHGRALGEASAAAVEPVRPHPGWSEQNPADWWTATLAAVDKLKAVPPAELASVRGIGLSGHMHGATLLGKNDEVLRPCILWNDGRSAAECKEMEAALPTLRAARRQYRHARLHRAQDRLGAQARAADLRQDRQGPAAQGLCAPAADRRACRRHVRRRRHAVARCRPSATGPTSCWPSPASTARHMPRLVEGSAVSGNLKRELAQRWGMDGLVVVAGGAGDNAASACGIGAIRPGEGFVSLGTSGVLFVSNERFSPNTEGAVHAFCHAIPDTWHQMGVILSATDSRSTG